MPIWKGTSIEETPEIELVSWRVYEVSSPLWEGRTRHFVGRNITENEGRVSSQIKSFDPLTHRAVTRSGRVYQLVGPPGSGTSDGQYVWSFFCDRNELFDILDVTDEVAGKARY